MKFLFGACTTLAILAVCLCENIAAETPEESDKDDVILVEMETESDQGKLKRQTAEGRVVGGTQHFQYGASPGHYLLRTKDASSEPEAGYLTLVKQYDGGQPTAQSSVSARQEFIVQSQQPDYSAQQFVREPKNVQLQSEKRPVYQQNQLFYQPLYQSSRPQPLRPAQAAKPIQGYYTNQGFVDTSNGQALHQSRLQAAFAGAEDKPSRYNPALPSIQYTPRPSPLGDSSFEKELAQLVAANQAIELKARPQQQQQSQYYQRYQFPQKQFYAAEQAQKQNEYAFVPQRPQAQSAKYVAPSLQRFKSQQPQKQLPEQYLIETTKPLPVQSKPVPQKVQQQYVQIPAEEPKYFSYQTYPEINAMKIVSAPQLQRAVPQAVHQQQFQYKPAAQKQTSEQGAPAYLQYYQTLKPQTDDPSSDSKLQYYRLPTPKAQASTSTPTTYVDQSEYVDNNYETQTKSEHIPKYVPYSSPKPQILTQFSAEDEQLIQSLLTQSLQKPRQGLSGFATDKTTNSESKQKIVPISPPSHSSIFVSKSLAPKKHSHSVTIESSPAPSVEPEEEIQTVRLPPPKNNKVYTQEEFQALVEAGYSVTPVPVRDDDDYTPSFSPAPANYPGHSQYQTYPTAAPEYQETKKPAEHAAVTAAPRKRKQRRPTIRPQYRYIQDAQQESESQPKATYISAEPEEVVINYGTRKQSRGRGHASHTESQIDDSQ